MHESMTPPSPTQSAEEAYREVHGCCPVAGCENHEEEFCCIVPETGCPYEWPGHAALDACIRAVLRERGHAAGCSCVGPTLGYTFEGFHDPRCDPPAWLTKEGK